MSYHSQCTGLQMPQMVANQAHDEEFVVDDDASSPEHSPVWPLFFVSLNFLALYPHDQLKIGNYAVVGTVPCLSSVQSVRSQGKIVFYASGGSASPDACTTSTRCACWGKNSNNASTGAKRVILTKMPLDVQNRALTTAYTAILCCGSCHKSCSGFHC